jgi:hypothetical protein
MVLYLAALFLTTLGVRLFRLIAAIKGFVTRIHELAPAFSWRSRL